MERFEVGMQKRILITVYETVESKIKIDFNVDVSSLLLNKEQAAELVKAINKVLEQ